MRRRILAGISVLFAIAAGSAGFAEASSPPLVDKRIPAYGITIGIPAGWQSTTRPISVGLGLTVKFFAHAPKADEGFRTNVILIVSKLRPGQTLRAWLFQGASSSLEYVGTTTAVTINGVHGLNYQSTKAFKSPDGKRLFTDEYALARGSRVFLFTYTSLANRRATYLPVFTESAQSIRSSR